ncbi:chromate transporter [Acidisphaera sp. S103]|uniref:chromate transporter n=1 Tax=Acidisphaera sp. S103 TaxID=1747223 RepID=UPI00131D8596|nr:chromate transporter [Acidisphaera sp. S103]
MNTTLLIQLARVFSVLSLVSIGGVNATLPETRRQVVEVHGWMTNASFADVFAISHAAPGPNIIMVSLIGWQLSGLVGLLVATLAIMAPSCMLAFVVSRVLGRWSDHPRIALLKAGLVPVALGLILASGVSMMRAANQDMIAVAISLLTAGFVVTSARNPLWALTAGMLVNVAAWRFF